VLYIKGTFRNCNIFTSKVTNKTCYDIKTGHLYNVDIFILIWTL